MRVKIRALLSVAAATAVLVGVPALAKMAAFERMCGSMYVTITGNADCSLVDGKRRRAGRFEGKVIEEIPGCVLAYGEGVTSVEPPDGDIVTAEPGGPPIEHQFMFDGGVAGRYHIVVVPRESGPAQVVVEGISQGSRYVAKTEAQLVAGKEYRWKLRLRYQADVDHCVADIGKIKMRNINHK